MNAAIATQTALPPDNEVSPPASAAKSTAAPVKWQKLVAPYRGGKTKRSLLQFATTFLGFAATCALSLYSQQWSLWPALLLALPAGGFLVRIFIIQHDHDLIFLSAVSLVGFFAFYYQIITNLSLRSIKKMMSH